MEIHHSGGLNSSFAVGRTLSSGWEAVFLAHLRICLSLEGLFFLAGAVDGYLDCELAALDLLAVHLGDSLLLQVLARERHEGETATLAGLVTGLELLDHEARDRAEGELGGSWLIGTEQLQKLDI